MLGDVGTHQVSPPAENHTGADQITPAAIGDQAGRQPAQQLWIPVIRAGTGPASASPGRGSLAG